MRQLIQGFRKLRLWTEDVPEFAHEGSKLAGGSFQRLPVYGSERRVTLEIFIPYGARCVYGALGARFRPLGDGHILDVRVMSSTGQGMGVPWSLAAATDQVMAGLPKEFGTAVLQSVLQASELSGFGAGLLVFDRAAYGLVS